jgi:ribonuclease HII
MFAFHKKHPKYNWADNKGYGTKEHYKAIHKYGLTELHRKTFLTKA